MKLPAVSILIPTYARTSLLEESLFSALHQTYAGVVEVLVLNACPRQTLSCDGVSIINAPGFSDAPLGLVRDTLIRKASHPLCLMWDDDDIYLPDHVVSLVEKLRDSEPAARLRRMLVWNGETLRERGGSTNAGHTVIFRRAAYGEAVTYDVTADAGSADNEFWQRAVKRGWFTGRHHHELDGVYTTLLRMDPGRVRASETEVGSLSPAHLRAGWCGRIDAGLEPSGAVTLTPRWSRDWSALADDFLAGGKAAHE